MEGVHKKRLNREQRFWRLVRSIIDPRAWVHMLKVVNFYNYTHVAELRKMKVHPDANISPNASFANGQNIEIKARATLGAHCQIWAGPGKARIVIGEDALFAPDVMVTAATYRYNDGAPVTKQAMDETDIIIGPDCWIGRGVTILAGTELGRGVIVAANSVVRGKFPDNAVIGGAPARAVAMRTLPGDAEADAAE